MNLHAVDQCDVGKVNSYAFQRREVLTLSGLLSSATL